MPVLRVDPCELVGKRSPSDRDRDVVVAGDSAQSTLWTVLREVGQGDEPAQHLVESADRSVIAAWIDGGAECLLPDGPRSFTFSEVQREVFDDLCTGCHFAPAREEFADLTLDQGAWSTLVEGNPPLVIPGDPEASLLYRKLLDDLGPGEGGRMPPLEAIRTDQLTLVYGWILEGAAP